MWGYCSSYYFSILNYPPPNPSDPWLSSILIIDNILYPGPGLHYFIFELDPLIIKNADRN